MTSRRSAILTIAGIGAAAALRLAHAQPRVVRIGLLGTIERELSPTDPAARKRLAELGYIEGKNISFTYMNSEGDVARSALQARELIALNPDVIMVMGPI